MPNILITLPNQRRHQQIPNAAAAAHALRYGNAPTVLRIHGLDIKDLSIAEEGLRQFNAAATPEERAAWCIKVPRDPDEDEPDDGVVTREKEEGKDWKSFLHYRPDLRELLKGRGVQLTEWQDLWLSACHRALHTYTQEYYQLLIEMDAQLPGYQFYDRAIACAEQHVLRVLQYRPRTGVIAAEHFDRNAISLSGKESLAGLYGYRSGKKIYCDRPEHPNAIVFSGTQLQKISDGKMPAFKHGVENLDPRHERSAVVFFGKMYGLDGVGS